MSTTTAKEAEALSYQELKDLLEKKKEAEIDKVTKELTAARGIVASLEAQLVNLGVTPSAPAPVAPTAVRRGRKAKGGTVKPAKSAKPAKAIKKAKGKRGAVGEAITKVVAGKGKAGAKIAEIAAATGFKPANITAFFYAKSNKGKFKKVKPATFAVAK